MCRWGMHPLTPLDPPLRVAIVRPDYRRHRRSANYDRLVCQHGLTPGPEKVQAALSGIQCLLAVPSTIGCNYVMC